MKVLLTGATGFIGSYILKALANGTTAVGTCFDVMATYRNANKIDAAARNCRWTLLDDQWPDKAREFAPDVIIHTAWAGVTVAERADWKMQISNIQMQQQLLDLNPKQFIALGSQAEYGTYDAVVDEQFPANPTSAYGAAKLACLDIVRSYCALNKIDWQWFRVFSAFGEGEADTWLIPSVVKKMQTELEMNATLGEQRCSYLYVGEIGRVIVKTIASGVPTGVYNLSGSTTISIGNLLEKIRDYVNPNFKLNFGAIPYREGQSMLMGCDNRKVCELICNVNDQDFDAKLKQTIDSYK